jgi:methionine-rich copper-binding protein CopC
MRIRDRAAPTLQQTTPTDNATDVAVSANLVLTFNEAVKAGLGNIEIRNAANGSLVESISITDTSKVSFAGSQLTINPGADLSPETSYYVTFASGIVRDLANNAFAGISSPTSFNFSTVASVPSGSPVLMSVIPADDATGIPIHSNIVLAFSEQVKPGSGNMEIRKSSDNSLVTSISIKDTFQVSFADHLVTLDPHITLDWNTSYYVTFAPGVILDLQNNPAAGIASPTGFNFTTTPHNFNPAPALVSQSPVDDATNVAVDGNLVFTFNEPITLAQSTSAIQFFYTDGSTAKYIFFEDTSQVSISGNTLTINPNTDSCRTPRIM